jgi:hypothetical protein
MTEPIEVNADDIATYMWRATWEVYFCSDSYRFQPDQTYRAAADCESDAIDEVIDWLEKNDPELLEELVLPSFAWNELSDAELDNLEYGGNHGHPLDPNIEISVTLVKRHDLARRYG